MLNWKSESDQYAILHTYNILRMVQDLFANSSERTMRQTALVLDVDSGKEHQYDSEGKFDFDSTIEL